MSTTAAYGRAKARAFLRSNGFTYRAADHLWSSTGAVHLFDRGTPDPDFIGYNRFDVGPYVVRVHADGGATARLACWS